MLLEWTIRRSRWNWGGGIVHDQAGHLLIHISADATTAPCKICSYICMLSFHRSLQSSLFLWSSLLGVLWSNCCVTPKINLRKNRYLFKHLTHGKRLVSFLHDYLFALPAVDFAACFSAWYLVSHTMFSRFETPHGPPTPRRLHKQGCPLSACVSPDLVLPGPPTPEGGRNHPGAAQEHPTGCLDWEQPGAPL